MRLYEVTLLNFRLENVDSQRNNNDQWITKQISPEFLLESQMKRLKLPYFRHVWKPSFLEKTLMLEKVEDGKMINSKVDGLTVAMDTILEDLK